MDKIKPAHNKLAFILYEAKSSPKYFELSKSWVKFLFYGLPLLTSLSLGAVFVGAIYFKDIRLMAEKKEPRMIKDLREKNKNLFDDQASLKTENTDLRERLASGVTQKVTAGFNSLNLFKPVPGQKDATVKPVLSLDEVDVLPLNDALYLRFNLVNTTKLKEKISGFLFVMLKFGNQIMIWPENAYEEDEMQIKFNDGEIFAFSNLRPVEAKFPTAVKQGKALLKILIFSRTGDLLHKQIISRNIKF